jgi:hypothetical protein
MDGGGDDMCEYVFNPIMRNFQAMQRLINMMRNTQQASSCTDFECFTSNNPNQNMLINNANQTDTSLFSSTWFMVMAWMMFALVLFVLRPNSFRNKNVDKKKVKSKSPLNTNRSFYGDGGNDDDDSSTIS